MLKAIRNANAYFHELQQSGVLDRHRGNPSPTTATAVTAHNVEQTPSETPTTTETATVNEVSEVTEGNNASTETDTTEEVTDTMNDGANAESPTEELPRQEAETTKTKKRKKKSKKKGKKSARKSRKAEWVSRLGSWTQRKLKIDTGPVYPFYAGMIVAILVMFTAAFSNLNDQTKAIWLYPTIHSVGVVVLLVSCFCGWRAERRELTKAERSARKFPFGWILALTAILLTWVMTLLVSAFNWTLPWGVFNPVWPMWLFGAFGLLGTLGTFLSIAYGTTPRTRNAALAIYIGLMLMQVVAAWFMAVWTNTPVAGPCNPDYPAECQ